jgi:hypothetical protein
MDVDHN